MVKNKLVLRLKDEIRTISTPNFIDISKAKLTNKDLFDLFENSERMTEQYYIDEMFTTKDVLNLSILNLGDTYWYLFKNSVISDLNYSDELVCVKQ